MDADAREAQDQDPEAQLVDAAAGGAGAQIECGGKAGDGQRQQDEEEDDEEAAEQLSARASIVERLAIDSDCRPDALANLGLAPEVVDAKREDAQEAVEETQAQEAAGGVRPADLWTRHDPGRRGFDCCDGHCDGHGASRGSAGAVLRGRDKLACRPMRPE